MLSAFSWGDFAQCTLIIVLCYYLAIGIIFYRAEITRLLSGFTPAALGNKNKDVTKSSGDVEEKQIEPVQETVEQAIKTKPVEDISKVYVELEEGIIIGRDNNITRAEILKSLGDIIKKHKNTIDKDVAETINQHIQSQLNIYSFQPLSNEELAQIWLH